jgi:hypothetical protein
MRYRLRAEVNGLKQVLRPIDVSTSRNLCFELPVQPGDAPPDLHLRFFDQGHKERRYDNYGVGFGRGFQWVLSSRLLQDDLGEAGAAIKV